MMMINSSQLQSKGIFYFWIYSGRVLSIRSDPYQALRKYTKQTKRKTTESESENIQNWYNWCPLSYPQPPPRKVKLAWPPRWTSQQKLIPSPTTPPTPRAPPAGLSASSPAPSSWSLLSGVPPPCSGTYILILDIKFKFINCRSLEGST